MGTVLVHLLIVWGLVIVAIVVARLFERHRKKDGEKPEYSVALGFVASSYGVLLGLLVAFGSNHYADVRHQAQAEAGSLLALYETLSEYPQPSQNRAQHQLVCYMRSIRDDDWPSMEAGNALQSTRAQAYGDQLHLTLRQLPQTGTLGGTFGRVQSQVTQADQARQQLLFFTESAVPTVMWVVIYAGAFLLVLLIALHYQGRPQGRLISLASVIVLLSVVVAVITILDQPYQSGAKVGPSSLNQVLDLLNEGTTNPAVFGPCAPPVKPV
jgi:hypothetical protein